MKLHLPTKKGQPNSNPEVDFKQLVVVGANGSGKTRFGSFIEESNSILTHRISAQKSLSLPSYVSTKSKEAAFFEFKYGHFSKDNPEWIEKYGWKSHRWNNNLNTSLLNDYDKLMVLLHTEEYEQSLFYKENGGTKPETKLDRIQSIFEKLLPHRKLLKKAGVVETYPTSGYKSDAYNASEMSDGERVILYIAGEVVCVPDNSLVIIDEPEMHIHKSLVKKLYDLIEQERPDCTFVYLTHDIDFAFSRSTALKIWAKSYESDNIWDYEILDDNYPIPDQLYLDVLGSRETVIFIEGDNSSIDYELYTQVFDNFTLKPVGSCDKVIHIVKAFNKLYDFHHVQSFGIIDKDRRQQADIVSLNRNKIWVLDVAEAENLLLIEPVVRAIARHMMKDENEVFIQVKRNVINYFSSQIEIQIMLHYKEILRQEFSILSNFNANNINEALTEIDNKFSGVDKHTIYINIKKTFTDILIRNDYDSILRVFNAKHSLIPNSNIYELVGIRNMKEYKNLTISLLKMKNDISRDIKSAIELKIIKSAN